MDEAGSTDAARRIDGPAGVAALRSPRRIDEPRSSIRTETSGSDRFRFACSRTSLPKLSTARLPLFVTALTLRVEYDDAVVLGEHPY